MTTAKECLKRYRELEKLLWHATLESIDELINADIGLTHNFEKKKIYYVVEERGRFFVAMSHPITGLIHVLSKSTRKEDAEKICAALEFQIQHEE